MKNLIYLFILPLLFISLVFVSCDFDKNDKSENLVDYDNYQYAHDYVLPDSSKKDMAKWITETVKSASQQMTGGDYEDPEDLIEQCEETGLRLFQVRVEGLNIKKQSNGYFEFVPKYELTPKELLIFNELKNKQ